MSINFNDVNGEAKKTKIDYFKFEEGDNEFRMVGGVLPRYVYWNTTPKNTPISLECLSFNRENEEFDNSKDPHKEHFPDINCKWQYVVQAFDKQGNLKVVALRKKMFETIKKNAAKHWGDPTHPDTGINIVVNKEKTGPYNYNVEYTVDVMSCKVQPLTDEQKKLLEESPTIDELFPRDSYDDQLNTINRIWHSADQEDDSNDNPFNDDIGDDTVF
jgi:hypothetical protein